MKKEGHPACKNWVLVCSSSSSS